MSAACCLSLKCCNFFTSKEIAEGMIEFAIKQGGKIDILVNSAGIMDGFKPIDYLSSILKQ